jgi:hypothetical protein
MKFTSPGTSHKSREDEFPFRGGEMGALIRALDWSKTSWDRSPLGLRTSKPRSASCYLPTVTRYRLVSVKQCRSALRHICLPVICLCRNYLWHDGKYGPMKVRIAATRFPPFGGKSPPPYALAALHSAASFFGTNLGELDDTRMYRKPYPG